MVQLQRLIVRPDQVINQQIHLTEMQQHYLVRVLRLRAGDRFIAVDQQGQWWLAALNADATAAILEIISANTELAAGLALLIALPKTGMDDIVRQATEIGVQQIVPILSQRTVLNPSAQKLERWQRIAQEAVEQSERQFVPEIFSPQAWTVALQTWNSKLGSCYICEPRHGHPHLLTHLLAAAPDSAAVVIAIGPEGGWTEPEIEQAIAVGYQPVSLGQRILRAVTAPLVALTLVAAVLDTGAARSSAVVKQPD
jgi:16S rRNA (uracil1498-N3)-methyltransferase